MDAALQITDPNVVKKGYYVRVVGDCVANIGAESPGLYMNGHGVIWVGNGEVIQGGPDIMALYNQHAGAVSAPAGMTAPNSAPVTPMAAGPGMGVSGPGSALPGPGMGVSGPGGGLPAGNPGMAGPGTAPAPAPMAGPGAIQPNHNFVANAVGAPMMAPPPQTMTPPASAAPVYQMTALAGGFTREQYLASGQNWTDELLLANGYMTRIA